MNKNLSMVALRLEVQAPHVMDPVDLDSTGVVTIGRSSKCTVRLPKDQRTVSRVHARLSFLEGNWRVEDLKSTTGTFVNARKLKPEQPHPLRHRDLLKVGVWVFKVSLADGTEDELADTMMVDEFNVSVSEIDLAALDTARVLRSALELPERLSEAANEDDILNIACKFLVATLAPGISSAHVVVAPDQEYGPPDVIAGHRIGSRLRETAVQVVPMLSRRVVRRLVSQPDSVVFLHRKTGDATLGATVAMETNVLGACLLEFNSAGKPVLLYASGNQAFESGEDLVAPYLRLVATLAKQHLLTMRRASLSKYFSPNVVKMLLTSKGGQKSPHIAEITHATSMFFDMRGFSLSIEESATDLVTFHEDLTSVMSIVTEEVFRTQGTVIDFQGDGLFAAWGVPYPQDEQSILAVRCAMAVISRLETVKLGVFERRRSRYFSVAGIGVARGDVVAGTVGSRKMFKYGLLGPSVNVASRLEALTKPDKLYAPVLVSRAVKEALEGSELRPRRLGKVRLAGMKTVEDVYEILFPDSPRDAHWDEDCDANWEEALATYERALGQDDLDRVEDLVSALPPEHPRATWLRAKVQELRAPGALENWDGVYQQWKG